MSKVVIAVVIVGMLLLVGSVYSAISQPADSSVHPTISQPLTSYPAAEVTPTPAQPNAVCGGSSCGG